VYGIRTAMQRQQGVSPPESRKPRTCRPSRQRCEACAHVQAGTLAQAGRYLGQSMRLMVGLPEYDTYVAHMEKTHPVSRR
jgi:hypothetical protein